MKFRLRTRNILFTKIHNATIQIKDTKFTKVCNYAACAVMSVVCKKKCPRGPADPTGLHHPVHMVYECPLMTIYKIFTKKNIDWEKEYILVKVFMHQSLGSRTCKLFIIFVAFPWIFIDTAIFFTKFFKTNKQKNHVDY